MQVRNRAVGEIKWYLLEPGDATRYQFGFWLPEGSCAYDVDGQPDRLSKTAPFFAPHAHDVMIFVANGSSSGCASAYLYDLEHLTKTSHYRVSYVKSYMPSCNPYTVVAVCAAIGVLAKEPNALYKACEAMLKVHGRKNE